MYSACLCLSWLTTVKCWAQTCSTQLVVNQITVRSCCHHKQTILEFIWMRDPPKGSCVVASVLTGVFASLQKKEKRFDLNGHKCGNALSASISRTGQLAPEHSSSQCVSNKLKSHLLNINFLFKVIGGAHRNSPSFYFSPLGKLITHRCSRWMSSIKARGGKNVYKCNILGLPVSLIGL